MRRVVITTGGTGGHIFPALAVAEEIRKRYPQAEILFLGGRYGPEAGLAAGAGLRFAGLPVRGVMGRGIKGLGALLAMGRSIFSAYGHIRSFSPELVLGFGGYASFPGLLAACLSSPRTAIHEQNAFPGLVNRVLGRRVDMVFLSMPDASAGFEASKCLLVGNPVREDIVRVHEKRLKSGRNDEAGVRRRLLVIGGSQGARALNEAMLAGLPLLMDTAVEILHQTGKADHERVRAAYDAAGAVESANIRVEPFIDDMAAAYAWADLVLSRSGASSLAEITASGLPSVLVPFPQAIRDHQRHNASFLRERGAAMLVDQEEFYRDGAANDRLAAAVLELLNSPQTLDAMGEKSFSLARLDAAARMVDALDKLLMRKK